MLYQAKKLENIEDKQDKVREIVWEHIELTQEMCSKIDQGKTMGSYIKEEILRTGARVLTIPVSIGMGFRLMKRLLF